MGTVHFNIVVHIARDGTFDTHSTQTTAWNSMKSDYPTLCEIQLVLRDPLQAPNVVGHYGRARYRLVSKTDFLTS